MIRFFVEIYLDVAVCAFLTIKMIYWDARMSALEFSNVLAISAIVLLSAVPIQLIVFFAWKIK